MSPLLIIFFPLFFSNATANPASAQSLSRLSAYEILEAYNFPVGLLPIGALRYDLDPSTREFSAYFNHTCTFSIQSYQIRYKATISGTISTNRLSGLRGISVKVLLFWINIAEVVRADDVLEFSVGIASADFPIDNFYECPQCGCGLDCVSVASV